MNAGGEVIEKALAQLAGQAFTPITFSFGWVAYSLTAAMRVFGDPKLMPNVDFPCMVVSGSGQRDNCSWILARILRDFEYWMPKEVQEEYDEMVKKRPEIKELKPSHSLLPRFGSFFGEKRRRVGLCISVFEISGNHIGQPTKDPIFYSGIMVIILQVVIAAVPLMRTRDYIPLVVTVAAISLCLVHSSLPQWRAEKWNGRRIGEGKDKGRTVSLVTGNGAKHVLVIICRHNAFNLEDMASPSEPQGVNVHFTRVVVALLACAWLAFLITVAGIQENSWFILASGFIGMAHNLVVAAFPREPKAFGMPLEYKECIAEPKVMQALMNLDEKYPSVGEPLVRIFFPGGLRPGEAKYWEERRNARISGSRNRKAELDPAQTISQDRVQAGTTSKPDIPAQTIPHYRAQGETTPNTDIPVSSLQS